MLDCLWKKLYVTYPFGLLYGWLDSFQSLTENESVKGDDVHQGPKLGTKPRPLLRASVLTNTFDEES